MVKIWQEDDATPGTDGHETVTAAYRRIFGKPWDKADVVSESDQGDGTLYTMNNGCQVWMSYPGNSFIRGGVE